MNPFIVLFCATVVVATALAAAAVWGPRTLPMKAAAIGLAGLLMATGYAAFVELLGRPKPAAMEWFAGRAKDARVVAARFREGKAIYLWLELDGERQPRAYVLPWSLAQARRLQEAMREAQANGTGVRMRRPFAGQGERADRMFYAEPQRPLPPKPPDTRS